MCSRNYGGQPSHTLTLCAKVAARRAAARHMPAVVTVVLRRTNVTFVAIRTGLFSWSSNRLWSLPAHSFQSLEYWLWSSDLENRRTVPVAWTVEPLLIEWEAMLDDWVLLPVCPVVPVDWPEVELEAAELSFFQRTRSSSPPCRSLRS